LLQSELAVAVQVKVDTRPLLREGLSFSYETRKLNNNVTIPQVERPGIDATGARPSATNHRHPAGHAAGETQPRATTLDSRSAAPPGMMADDVLASAAARNRRGPSSERRKGPPTVLSE